MSARNSVCTSPVYELAGDVDSKPHRWTTSRTRFCFTILLNFFATSWCRCHTDPSGFSHCLYLPRQLDYFCNCTRNLVANQSCRRFSFFFWFASQVVVLGLCILLAYLIRRNRIFFLPESSAAILVGVVVGGMAKLFYPTKDELDFLSFNSVSATNQNWQYVVFIDEGGRMWRRAEFRESGEVEGCFLRTDLSLSTAVTTQILGFCFFFSFKHGEQSAKSR